MRGLALVLVVSVLAGCATKSELVTTGPGVYLAYEERRDTHLLAQYNVLDMATEVCEDKAGELLTLETTSVPRSMGQFPMASMRFQCIKEYQHAPSSRRPAW
jgi:hypothetical protein